MLSIIAEEDEIAAFAKVAPDERPGEWVRFWKRRDSNPRTEENEELGEFLSRLRYVIKTFSRFRHGWETDRGRVYIRYGPPDKIVDREGRSLGSSYKLWYYYSRNIVYVFEDTLGTGEFRLKTAQPI